MSLFPWPWTRVATLAALVATSALAYGDEQQLFDRAEKVVWAKVVLWGGAEPSRFSRRDLPFHYQRLHLEDVEVFKGPKHPERFGYDIVMVPIQGPKRGPFLFFERHLGPSDFRPEKEALFFLTRNEDGTWMILDGQEGLYHFPGKTRLQRLRAKAPSR